MRFTSIFLTLLLFTSFATTILSAQEETTITPAPTTELADDKASDPISNKNRDDETADVQHISSNQNPLKDENLIMLFLLLLFSAGVLFFIWKVKDKELFDSENYFRLIILSLVILATMILIVGGYDNRQLAPAFGILGTIAGYLLGRQDKPNSPNP